MSFRFVRWAKSVPYAVMSLVIIAALVHESPLHRHPEAGGCTGFFGGGQSVGGISIDAAGTLKNAELGAVDDLRKIRAQALQEVPGDLRQANPLRKVSLRKLEATLAEHLKTGKPAPDAIHCLAGLQNIRYVLVYPEQNDIVLAGFGEGWKVDGRGNFVGLTTGKPVLLLDDLLVALRSVRQAGRGQITCSIDPTADGLKRLREYVSGLTTIGDPDTTLRTIEQLMGPQTVNVTGVPNSTHFARVLVAADYRMKRLGMGFEPSPVYGMPSYLQMMKSGGRGMQNMTPRWWMVPNYGGVLKDAEGLTWELRGAAVKTLTEETFFGDNGARNSNTGKINPMAQRWAETMTAKYDELALKEPIFGELRNCMDMALVALLLAKEGLPAKVNHDFSLLMDAGQLPSDEFIPPKQIDTLASFVRKSGSWVISASGGVKIEAWESLAKAEKSDALAPVRKEATAGKAGGSWWWN